MTVNSCNPSPTGFSRSWETGVCQDDYQAQGLHHRKRPHRDARGHSGTVLPLPSARGASTRSRKVPSRTAARDSTQGADGFCRGSSTCRAMPLEKDRELRPNALFPLDIVVCELDKKLAACGVTTTYLPISFAENEIGVRSNTMAAEIITKNPFMQRNAFMCVPKSMRASRSPTALRCLGWSHCWAMERSTCFTHGPHPGQGQFREVLAFRNDYQAVYRKNDEEIRKIIDRKVNARQFAKNHVDHITRLCRSFSVPMASHDDDCREKIEWLSEQDIRISEFPPVNIKVVREAVPGKRSFRVPGSAQHRSREFTVPESQCPGRHLGRMRGHHLLRLRPHGHVACRLHARSSWSPASS